MKLKVEKLVQISKKWSDLRIIIFSENHVLMEVKLTHVGI